MGERMHPDGASQGGVDVSLIEETLRLTPLERLRQNDRAAELAERLRAAFARQWPNRAP